MTTGNYEDTSRYILDSAFDSAYNFISVIRKWSRQDHVSNMKFAALLFGQRALKYAECSQRSGEAKRVLEVWKLSKAT